MSFFTFFGRTTDGVPPGVALPSSRTSTSERSNQAAQNSPIEDSSSGAVVRSAYVPSVKIVIVGESSVGKSALAWRFCRGGFTSFTEPTVGAAFLWRIAEIPIPLPTNTAVIQKERNPATRDRSQTNGGETQRLKFEIWDTAGQERYRCLVPVYYRGATAALVVYDVTDHTSFERSVYWIQELRRNMNHNRFFIMLVGTKADMAEERAVTADEGVELAEREMLAGFLETSAREDINVEEVFIVLGQIILENLEASGELAEETGNSSATRVPAARMRDGGTSSEHKPLFSCC